MDCLEEQKDKTMVNAVRRKCMAKIVWTMKHNREGFDSLDTDSIILVTLSICCSKRMPFCMGGYHWRLGLAEGKGK